METFLVQSTNGLVLAASLILVSLGLSLIFGMLGIVNFAHGAFYALGALLMVTVVRSATILPGREWLGFLIAPLVVAVLGMGLERIIIRPVLNQPFSVVILVTYALTLIIEEGGRMIWGTIPYSIDPPPSLQGTVSIVGSQFPVYRLATIVVAALLAAALLIFLERTRLGLSIKAASEDREMASAVGVNTKRLFSLVFGIGIALAALSGAVSGPIFSVYPAMGSGILIDCFVVLVIGGLGSLRGAILASIMVALVRTLGMVFVSQFAIALEFALMAVVLLVRPRGILNEGRFE